MMGNLSHHGAAGPLADYQIGQRVQTKEGFPGVINDILEGPADLTTYWVTLDNGLGGGEYAEAEIWPAAAQPTAQLASVEHTARDDYPELGTILTDRPPPQITTTSAKQVTSEDTEEASAVAARLALYLPPKAETEPKVQSEDPGEQQGYTDGFAHGKEGITRDPAQPADTAYMAGYEQGWADGVMVYRQPANTFESDDLDAQQVAEITPDPIPTTTTLSMLDRLAQMERHGAPDLPFVEAGALMDFIKGTPPQTDAYKDVGTRFSYDWCRFRRMSHCWLPKDLNEEASKQAGYAVWNPVDRGSCPRITWKSQQACPTGEPGPHVPGGFTDATVPWDQGGQHGAVPSGMYRQTGGTTASLDHHEFVPDPAEPHMCAVCHMWRYAHPGEKPLQMAAAFEVTATWADVRRKAKRIRSEGGVRVVGIKHGDEIVAHVKGDHGVYETWLRRNPGRDNVAFWHCGCKWGHYAWGRSPQFKRFEGRMCSHALALQYEAQSRSMFGRELTLDEKQPAWMDQKHVHLPGDYDRTQRRYTHLEVTSAGHLSMREVDAFYDPDYDGEDVSPAVQIAAAMLSDGAKYKDIRPALLAMGITEPARVVQAARATTFRGKIRGIIRDLILGEDGHVHDQHTGEHIDHHEVLYPGWDPTYGLNPNDSKLGAKKPDAPKVSGVALKAADTGRVLMLQRSMDDDKASGKWEWPGGHHEDGDLTSLHAAIREWQEEVGQPFPPNGYVAHTWTSPNGIYQGHLVVIPSEKDLVLHEGRIMENPDDPDSEACEQVAWWDPDDAKRNPALREEVKATTPWAQVKAAGLAKTADAVKDPEFERQHPRDDDGKFTAAARAMMAMAKRNEPKTTAFLQANAKRTGGKMEGLKFKFKDEDSLLRKMHSEAHEYGGDPGRTAANMSDTLRYTTVYDPEHYTSAVNSTLEAMKQAGYRMRVKNYWGRGDAYNGINVAAMTPTGHPFELQFHTPESLDVKENIVHPIYKVWREDSTPEGKRKQLAAQMRDYFDNVPRPAGALGISHRKNQPMPGAVPGYHLRAASLPATGDGYYYLLLHTHDSAEPVTVLRTDGGSVQVWRDGDWVTHNDYGRFFFKGEPRTEPIDAETAAQFVEKHGHTAKGKDTNVPPSEHGDPRLQDAGVSVKRTPAGKYYVCTHRARGKYRDSVADIPDSEIEFIRSTGVRKTERGTLQPTATKEATMDIPDEFGSLFDEMPIDPRRTAAIQSDPGTCSGFGLPGLVAHGDEWGLDVSSGFVVADLNDEPEPALPTTDGSDEDEDEETQYVAQRLAAAMGHPARQLERQPELPTQPATSLQRESDAERGRRLLAYVDDALAGRPVDGPNPFAHLQAGQADNEIAAAAANHLATKQALKTYDAAERRAIINEGEGVTASNLDRLDIKGTHYEALAEVTSKSDDEDLWMLDGDPNGVE